MNRSARVLQILALAVLAMGLAGLDFGALLAWLSAGLLLMAALKLIEARSLPERRLVSLLSLIAAGVLGAQQPDLLPSLLQLLASGLALAGLLALELGAGLSWRAVLRRSLAVLLAALPVALMLFLLVPRIAPLWPAPSLRGPGTAAVTGLSADLDPGSIASLTADDQPAARVSFSSNTPPPRPGRYWRVLVHQDFDGTRWRQAAAPERPAAELPAAAGPDAAGGLGASQVWLVEASPVNALPWSGQGQSEGSQLRPSRLGELRLRQAGPRPGANAERQAYLLRRTEAPAAWQRQPASPVDLVLPADRNPRLAALGASWGALPTPEQRLAAAEAWFGSQGFRYSRSPGALPERHGLDTFLFERREGFCGHYASAFTALMRAAGVPARVVSGYLGGRWVQPLAGAPFLELRHSDAHAWSEVWLPGGGWQRVDPSAWISGGGNGSNPLTSLGETPNAARPRWIQWLQWQWWGLDLAWSRWWLGFDRAGQEALLQRLFGEQRAWLGAVLLVLVAGLLALGLVGLEWGRRSRDRKRRPAELRALLRWLQHWGITPLPGESIEQLCRRASAAVPQAAAPLTELARQHNQWHYAQQNQAQRAAGRAAWRTALRRLQQLAGPAL